MSAPALLCVSDWPPGTGYAWEMIEELFNRVAEVLSRQGIRTLVAYPGHQPLPLGRAAESIACDFRPQGLRSLREALALVRHQEVRAVWLISRQVVSPAYALLRLGGVRRVVVHDHSSGVSHGGPRVRRLAKAVANRLPWASADVVVAVSGYVAERLRTAGQFPADRIRRIPNPVEIPNFSRPPEALRAELGVAPGRRLVAAAGRLAPEKGFADLLRAADFLPESVELVVFGDGPERAALERLRSSLRTGSRMRLAGHHSAAAEWVAAADVCVVPSRWEEAFCLAAAEGLARARPMVATEVGAIPEFVRDGETGLLVPPGNPAALSQAIRRLLDAPELGERLGRAGQDLMRREYTWDRALTGLLEVFAPAFPEARVAALAAC